MKHSPTSAFQPGHIKSVSVGKRVGSLMLCALFGVGLLVGTADAQSLFSQSLSFPVAGGPSAVDILSVGDDNPDLLVANGTGVFTPSVSVLTNESNGVVFSEARIQVPEPLSLAQAVAGGDFNGDGLGDFAVAGDDLSAETQRTVVAVYTGSVGGSWSLRDQEALDGVFPHCLLATDLDGNGATDLIVCHARAGESAGRITILNGAGDGTFALGQSLAVGSNAASAAVADLDADGALDIVVADPTEGSVFALFGSGSGPTVDSPVELASVQGAQAVAALAEGSGRVVVATDDSGVGLTVLAVDNGRAVDAAANPNLAEGSFVAAAVADVDADDILEVAVVTRDPNSVLILEVDAGGATALRETVELGIDADALAAADLGGNGLDDLVLASAQADRIFVLMNGSRTLPAAMLCGTEPAPICEVGSRSKLKLRNSEGTGSDQFNWRWQSAQVQVPSGNPLEELVTFAFCLYGSDGTTGGRLMLSHTTPALCGDAPCWKAKGSSGYRYRDSERLPQGVGKFYLSHPKRGGTKVVMRGRGENLVVPNFPLDGSQSVVAQVVNDRGACWQTSYGPADMSTGAQFFKARSRTDR